jgi:NADH-quinone oxidoreductase subunit G
MSTGNLLKIEIDGQLLEVAPGTTVIEAADAAGITIPRFCYHEKLSVAANCRMCLVDVEKAPKPLPACATPVTDGMKVQTRSARAVNAQKGVMELLLINHPLDCPVCDQGGECDLQDLAVGYGGDVSCYTEPKRIVKDKNLGPLIATEMTRCIHCTRCVRFGEELAGVMELGATGRGEHTRIGTYVEQSVDSELSGNAVDLCPVGALTSKPFRFSARSWELTDKPSVSPHDCVGANLHVQVRRERVMRVLPRENDDVNEIWLADRDRFSYEALNSAERLTRPLIREGQGWRETDWPTALNAVVTGMKQVIASHGASAIGTLAAPTSTLEEFYLLQKLMRGLGSGNIDHRLRSRNTRDDAEASLAPGLGMPIRELEHVEAAVLIGSNIRKDQPLLGLRLRKAAQRGAAIAVVNSVDVDLALDAKARVIVDPASLPAALARIARELAAQKDKTLSADMTALAQGSASESEKSVAALLAKSGKAVILVGNGAQQHAQAATLRALADALSEFSGAALGILPEANGTAGWLAGCLPTRGENGRSDVVTGRSAMDMLVQPLKGYFIFGAEPDLDCADGRLARTAFRQAQFVVQCSAFRPHNNDWAHVVLPITPFTETDGTFVNAEGRFQSFAAAVAPQGEARPGWKVLRVLGNQFGLKGFDYTTAEEVRNEIKVPGVLEVRLKSRQVTPAPSATDALQRIIEVPLYRVDALVRRAPALQQTRDNPGPVVRMNPREAQKRGVGASARLRVTGGAETVTLDFLIDRRIPDGCALIPSGYAETVALGCVDTVRVEGA